MSEIGNTQDAIIAAEELESGHPSAQVRRRRKGLRFTARRAPRKEEIRDGRLAALLQTEAQKLAEQVDELQLQRAVSASHGSELQRAITAVLLPHSPASRVQTTWRYHAGMPLRTSI